MRIHTTATALACCGALAYAIGKVEMALRGEVGMQGFPAPPEAYEQIPDPTGAQLGNAAMGFVLVVVTALLFRPPRRVWPRRAVLTVNWLGVAMIAAGVGGFTLRATGMAPGLGAPAVGASTWITLAIGAVWVLGWVAACVGAGRRANLDRVQTGVLDFVPWCRRPSTVSRARSFSGLGASSWWPVRSR